MLYFFILQLVVNQVKICLGYYKVDSNIFEGKVPDRY